MAFPSVAGLLEDLDLAVSEWADASDSLTDGTPSPGHSNASSCSSSASASPREIPRPQGLPSALVSVDRELANPLGNSSALVSSPGATVPSLPLHDALVVPPLDVTRLESVRDILVSVDRESADPLERSDSSASDKGKEDMPQAGGERAESDMEAQLFALMRAIEENNLDSPLVMEAVGGALRGALPPPPPPPPPTVPTTTRSWATCFICFEELPLTTPPRPGHSPDCHWQLCDACLHDQLGFHIRNADVSRLECPSCYFPIEFRQIEELCTPDVVVKYHRFLVERYVAAQPHVKRCGLPGCENAVIGDEACSIQNWTCEVCSVLCPFCKQPAHAAGLECDAFKRFHAAERGHSRFARLRVGAKRCPSCGIVIIKNGGCPHMSCKCGAQFCWRCKEDWKTHGVCKWERFWTGVMWGTSVLWGPLLFGAAVAAGSVVLANLPFALVAYVSYRKWRKWRRGY